MAPMEHLRVPLAAQVAMGATGPMAAQVEPVGSVVWLEDLEQLPEPMDSAATVAQADRPEPQESAAMEPQAMRCLPMAATAAMAAIPVWQEMEESAERRAELEPPQARMAPMGPSQPAVEMEGMAEQVSARQRPAQLEAMAETEALAELLATAVSEEPVATEPQGRMALRDRCPGNLARTARPEVRAEWAEPGVLADRFQAMVEQAAWRAWAELEALAERELRERMGFRPVKPVARVASEVSAAQAEMEDWAEWAVRPSMAWRARPESMALGALGAREVLVVSAVTELQAWRA
jgi:hypothetical protein